MNLSRLMLAVGAGAVLSMPFVPPAQAAESKQIAYYNFPSSGSGYLIDWQPKKRVRVVTYRGAGAGSVSDSGTQKLITLDQPLSVKAGSGSDECGSYEFRNVLKQIVVREVSARAVQIVQIGEEVTVGGCEDGQATPYGSPDAAGLAMKALAMSKRPPMADLQPGLQLAGPAEGAWTDPTYDLFYPSQGVVTVQNGAVSFQSSGRSYATSISADGWWVMDLDGFRRAQTRLETDSKTGGEEWLIADWADGVPQRLAAVAFVKTLEGAGFGTKSQAARMWQVGSSIDTNMPYYTYLYKDGTGERVLKYLDTGLESRSPITAWGLKQGDLWWKRVSSGSTQMRRWVPLRNQGKAHWVIESAEQRFDDGPVFNLTPPRVMYYLDTGKAVPPAR